VGLDVRKPKRKGAATTRTNDPERTKANIIQVATEEFSEVGYSGARIDRIADRMNTSKRMIYYYFGSKEGLYSAVLLEYYRNLRGAEADLRLDEKPPLEALKELMEFTFDYHAANADNVRLVMVENIHKGKHIKQMPNLEPMNTSVIDTVGRICERGVKLGVIRAEVKPWDVYTSIAALSFFNVSNRYTFSAIFNHDMISPQAAAERRAAVVDMIIRYVKA
jgi:AcrR family transcriptional regulator